METTAAGVPEGFAAFLEQVGDITDHRFARVKVRPLVGVLELTVLVLMVGAQPMSDIRRYGKAHPEILGSLGACRDSSVATLSRLWPQVSIEGLRHALAAFAIRVATPARCRCWHCGD